MNSSFMYFTMAIGVALGALGSYLCERKGRPRYLGFVLGFLFGLIGILVILLLSKKTEPQQTDQDQTN